MPPKKPNPPQSSSVDDGDEAGDEAVPEIASDGASVGEEEDDEDIGDSVSNQGDDAEPGSGEEGSDGDVAEVGESASQSAQDMEQEVMLSDATSPTKRTRGGKKRPAVDDKEEESSPKRVSKRSKKGGKQKVTEEPTEQEDGEAPGAGDTKGARGGKKGKGAGKGKGKKPANGSGDASETAVKKSSFGMRGPSEAVEEEDTAAPVLSAAEKKEAAREAAKEAKGKVREAKEAMKDAAKEEAKQAREAAKEAKEAAAKEARDGPPANLLQCSLCDAKVVQLVRHIRAQHGGEEDYDTKIKEARLLEQKALTSRPGVATANASMLAEGGATMVSMNAANETVTSLLMSTSTGAAGLNASGLGTSASGAGALNTSVAGTKEPRQSTLVRPKNTQCPICEKVVRRYDLNKHIKNVHSGQKPNKCPYCDYASPWKGNLNTHIAGVHTQSRLHECVRCGLSFKTRGAMIGHMRKVHDKMYQPKERGFECGECNKKFFKKFHLQRHMRVHTGEKPYTCAFCEKKFASKTNMDTHIQSVHLKIKPFKCGYCDKGFGRKKMMLAHIRKYHMLKAEMAGLEEGEEGETAAGAEPQTSRRKRKPRKQKVTAEDDAEEEEEEEEMGEDDDEEEEEEEGEMDENEEGEAAENNEGDEAVIKEEKEEEEEGGSPKEVNEEIDGQKEAIEPVIAAPTVVWPVTSSGVIPGVTGAVRGDNVAYIQLDQGRLTNQVIQTTNKGLVIVTTNATNPAAGPATVPISDATSAVLPAALTLPPGAIPINLPMGALPTGAIPVSLSAGGAVTMSEGSVGIGAITSSTGTENIAWQAAALSGLTTVMSQIPAGDPAPYVDPTPAGSLNIIGQAAAAADATELLLGAAAGEAAEVAAGQAAAVAAAIEGSGISGIDDAGQGSAATALSAAANAVVAGGKDDLVSGFGGNLLGAGSGMGQPPEKLLASEGDPGDNGNNGENMGMDF